MTQLHQPDSHTPASADHAKERLKGVAADVGITAKEHTVEVGEEVAAQTRHLAGEVRRRLTDEVGTQNDRLSASLRQLSDDLGGMRGNAGNDSLAAAVVQRLSEGSRQVAGYLEQKGPDGVIHEVQEFARRKPGTFLFSAAVAGFVTGRLGKGILTGGSNGPNGSSGAHDPASTSTAGGAVTGRPASVAVPVPNSGPAMPTGTPAPGSPAAMPRRNQP